MKFLVLLNLLIVNLIFAQSQPEITGWIINTDNTKGYNNILSNVQKVHYTETEVYVSCTCIPGYDIGPWAGNPNTPANQNFCFKLTRSPKQNTGSLTATGLGHIGVWRNGVSIFNAKDAFSYKNQGFWNQDALFNEGSSFDDCLGHPAPNGEYHHHVNPTCLYDDTDSLNHSPVIGFSFDGFPIYGAYGYENPDGTGKIRRILSSYRKRSITERSTLPSGQVLQSSQYGPAVDTQNPLGKYIEDFEYVSALGDLDSNNGRFCITPEYPQGTYAYFVTIDNKLQPVYPYVIGKYYYGNVPQGNTGPQSGHNTIPDNAVLYSSSSDIPSVSTDELYIYPNPVSTSCSIKSEIHSHGHYTIRICNTLGRIVSEQNLHSLSDLINTADLAAGAYTMQLFNEDSTSVIVLSFCK